MSSSVRLNLLSNLQEKLPSISKQNGAREQEEEPENNTEKKKVEEGENVELEPNNGTVVPEKMEEGEERLSSKTPDLVPKSFQDKRSEKDGKMVLCLL